MPHVHTAGAAHRTRLAAVFGLAIAIFLIELVGGVASNSLALLADAAHLFTDITGIGLALLAIWFAGRPANAERTFGYLRLEILAAVANAVLLFGVTGFVLFEAFERWSDPPVVASALMVGVALVGLFVNALSMYLLREAQRSSLNMRGAYLEVMGDFAGSAAVVIAGIVILATGWLQADAVASAVIAVLILGRTWGLLREAVDVLLEATPRGIDMAAVREHILEAPGVVDVHDLHAWTITSGMNVVSAHVITRPDADSVAVLDHLCQCLTGVFDIEHSTFQLETADRRPLEEGSHA